MKRTSVASLLAVSLLGVSTWLAVPPANAQKIQFGDNFGIDLSNRNNRRTETNFRVSTEGNRLNLGVDEQRKPETRIRLDYKNGSPQVDIRRVQPPPEPRLRLSVPLGN